MELLDAEVDPIGTGAIIMLEELLNAADAAEEAAATEAEEEIEEAWLKAELMTDAPLLEAEAARED